MKNNRKKIVASLLTLGLVLSPITSQARGFSGGHVSHVSHVSHTSHVSHSSVRSSVRVSTPKVSAPRISSPKVSRPKSVSPKISKPTPKSTSVKSTTKVSKSSVKSEVKTTKKSTVKKVDSSNKFTTKPTSKVKQDTKKVSKTKVTSTKTINKKVVINKNYKITPRRSTTIVVSHPTYYTRYATTPIYYHSGASFWDYYMLSTILDHRDNVTERDIARALEQQGYSQGEVDQILKDAKNENKKISRDSFWRKFWKCFWFIVKATILISILYVIYLYFRKRY